MGASAEADAEQMEPGVSGSVGPGHVGPLGSNSRTERPPVRPADRSCDPRRLKPTDLSRLLNATPLGSVTNDRRIRRQREAAGLEIGDGRYIDLFRYVGWLVVRRHLAKPPKVSAESLSVPGLLALLDGQQYRCALSGRKLAPENTSLDHILPVSRGGGHTLKNAQALANEVNRAKHTLTNAEFIQLCRDVVAFADAKAV